MALAADDVHDRLAQLIALTERLTERLEAEAQAFEARRPQDVAGTTEDTQRLANVYRRESARIRADRSLVAGASEADRRALIAATRRFETVLARHTVALTAAKAITEGLVRAVAAEISAQRTPQAYGAAGRTAAASAAAVTLNRQA